MPFDDAYRGLIWYNERAEWRDAETAEKELLLSLTADLESLPRLQKVLYSEYWDKHLVDLRSEWSYGV